MNRIPVRIKGDQWTEALVDDGDYEWLSRWSWRLVEGYAKRGQRVGGRVRSVAMHREILDLTWGDGMEGDHHDGDRLNNRRTNLRLVTPAQQHQNIERGHGYRGVSLTASGRWRARVKLGYREVYLGTYPTAEDAAIVAESWRAEHMPYANEARGTM